MARPRKRVSISAVFAAARVLTFGEISRRTQVSESTVVRRLREHGYHSSYNCAGRFITIDAVTDFDEHGLWHLRGARFSQWGTLKCTVEHFVSSAEGGFTQAELASLLGVRVHNVLLDLVTEAKIRRQRLGATFVYLSSVLSRQNRQIKQRKALLAQPPKPRPNSQQKIAILLHLLEDPKATRQQIVQHSRAGGIQMSGEVVDLVFEICDLEKKRAR